MLDFSENKYRKFIHLSSKMLDLEMIIEKSETDSYQNSPSFVEVNSKFVSNYIHRYLGICNMYIFYYFQHWNEMSLSVEPI